MGISPEGGGGPTLLSVADVLSELRICKAFFYKLVRSARGPILTKIGDRTFVSRANLTSWLATCELNNFTGEQTHAPIGEA